MPPILTDPDLAKSTYDKLEKDVEKGVRESATREKAFPTSTSARTSSIDGNEVQL